MSAGPPARRGVPDRSTHEQRGASSLGRCHTLFIQTTSAETALCRPHAQRGVNAKNFATRPEKEPPRRAAQVREETPKVGGNTERHVRCCTAQFNVALHKCKGGGRRGAMHHRLEPVTTNRPTRKSPALGRASKSFAESV